MGYREKYRGEAKWAKRKWHMYMTKDWNGKLQGTQTNCDREQNWEEKSREESIRGYEGKTAGNTE